MNKYWIVIKKMKPVGPVFYGDKVVIIGEAYHVLPNLERSGSYSRGSIVSDGSKVFARVVRDYGKYFGEKQKTKEIKTLVPNKNGRFTLEVDTSNYPKYKCSFYQIEFLENRDSKHPCFVDTIQTKDIGDCSFAVITKEFWVWAKKLEKKRSTELKNEEALRRRPQ